MPQLSIDLAPANGYAGQIAEPGAPLYSRSATAEGSGIVAGAPVLRGTNTEKEVVAVGASSVVTPESFAGFAMLETSREYDASAPIAAGDGLAVVQIGVIYLVAGETVAAGEDVAVTLSSGALLGLGAEEACPSGSVRLPGCRWVESGAAGKRAAFVFASGAKSDLFTLTRDAAAIAEGANVAEAQIGCAPEAGRLVAAYFINGDAAISAGTSGATTDLQVEVNRRTKALPGTQVPVANGSNVDADAHAFDGDGAVAAWESIAMTLTATVANLQCLPGDVFTYEAITGAGYTLGAHSIQLVFVKNA